MFLLPDQTADHKLTRHIYLQLQTTEVTPCFQQNPGALHHFLCFSKDASCQTLWLQSQRDITEQKMTASNINQIALIHKRTRPACSDPEEKLWKTNRAEHSSMGFTEDRKLASWSRNAALIGPRAPFPAPHWTQSRIQIKYWALTEQIKIIFVSKYEIRLSCVDWTDECSVPKTKLK